MCIAHRRTPSLFLSTVNIKGLLYGIVAALPDIEKQLPLDAGKFSCDKTAWSEVWTRPCGPGTCLSLSEQASKQGLQVAMYFLRIVLQKLLDRAPHPRVEFFFRNDESHAGTALRDTAQQTTFCAESSASRCRG